MKILLLIVLLTVPSLAACSSDEASAPSPTPPASASGQPPTPPSGAEPFTSVTSRTPTGGTGQSDGQGSPITAPGAIFTLPSDWISEQPSSSMRLAQARIPGATGEGQLTVFYFGAGGGGGLESNLSRWIGQVEVAPGNQPHRETFDSGDFRITWIEVQGTIKPSTMGTGPSEPQADSRMLAAVVEGPQGPWYFKATGPSATLEAQREAFLGMLRSAVAHG